MHSQITSYFVCWLPFHTPKGIFEWTDILYFNIEHLGLFLYLFYILFKKRLHTPELEDVHMFFSKKLYCLNFHTEIYSLSGIDFCVWHEVGVKIPFFLYGYPVDPSTVIEKTPSPTALKYCRCHKSGDCICVGVFLDALMWAAPPIPQPVFSIPHRSFKIGIFSHLWAGSWGDRETGKEL